MMEPSLQQQFERCRPWIEAALEYSGGTHTVDDVYEGIVSGQLHFWPAPDGCLVTEFITFPRKKVINVFLGGGDMDQLTEMTDSVVEFGKANGCDAAMISGRRGWARVFNRAGFEIAHTVLEKEI